MYNYTFIQLYFTFLTAIYLRLLTAISKLTQGLKNNKLKVVFKNKTGFFFKQSDPCLFVIKQ